MMRTKEFMIIITGLNLVNVVILLDVNGEFSEDKALKQNAFDTVGVIGPQKCIEECLLRSKCNVVSFSLEHYRCELGDDKSLLQTTTEKKYISFNNLTSYNYNLGPCHNHHCEVGTKCIQLTSGKTTCAQTECKDPPIIPNATVGKSRAIAESTSYSCNSGYFPYGNNKITCKANGEWTTTSFYCGPCMTGFTYVNEDLPTMQKFCYKVLTVDLVNHTEAVKNCAAEKSTLIKVNSQTKMNALSSLTAIWHWADGMDDVLEDDWKYSDGTPLERSIFDSGQPNGGTDQNCMAFHPQKGFHDRECEKTYKPLCEHFI